MEQELIRFFERLDDFVRDAAPANAFHFPLPAQQRRLLALCPAALAQRWESGEYLFTVYQPLTSVYIMLSGNCCVEKYKESGAVMTDHARYPLQMFGLFEGLAGIGYYTTTIRCTTACTFVVLPVEQCCAILRERPALMWMTLRFLSTFIADYIDSSDLLMLNNPDRAILAKLYRGCLGRPLPVTLPYKKEELARDLNMNLRTLYRHLAELYRRGFMSSVKGKLTIDAAQLEKIRQYLDAPPQKS